MTIIIISIVTAWIIFSAFIVTILCMNSSRLSRIDEPFKDPFEIKKMMEEHEENLDQD